jgi:hypothetical protein
MDAPNQNYLPPPPQVALTQTDPIPLGSALTVIHQTQLIFVKDKFPDGFIFPPVTTAPSLNMSRPLAKTANRYRKHIPVTVRKVPFPIPPMRSVHRNGLT